MYTTLNKIREHKPCAHGWETLLKHLGKTKPDNEPLSLLTILDSNGFDDTLWCFLAVEGFEKEKQLLAITYAKEVQHLMPAEPKKALEVFERYANGLATQEEFEAARRVAADAYTAAIAARAAHAAAHVSWAASWAAHASWAADAGDAVYWAADAAADASWAAAHAAWGTASAAAAARAATWSAYDAVRAAARSTIQAKQESQLRQLLERTCTQP